MSPSEAFRSALAALQAALDELAIPSAIIGGVAAIARGVDRSTADVDATVAGDSTEPQQALAVLERHGIRPRVSGVLEHVRKSHVLLLTHEASKIRIDLSFGWLPFEAEAMRRAERIDFDGVRVRVITAEDLVIYKAVAWRPTDREDIERVVARWGGRLDLARIRAWVRQFAEVLEEPERIDQFEALLRRASGA